MCQLVIKLLSNLSVKFEAFWPKSQVLRNANSLWTFSKNRAFLESRPRVSFDLRKLSNPSAKWKRPMAKSKVLRMPHSFWTFSIVWPQITELWPWLTAEPYISGSPPQVHFIVHNLSHLSANFERLGPKFKVLRNSISFWAFPWITAEPYISGSPGTFW